MIFQTKKAVNMKIQNTNQKTNFGQLYIVSNEAQKLLKKADRAIKASDAKFINTNIPEGHKRPLWSVLSEDITQRQSENPNNIIIDLANKTKQLLSVKIIDKQGYTINKYEVNPFPTLGNHNKIFPTNDLYKYYYHSLDQKIYGKSDLYDVMDRAEFEVDLLYKKQLEEMPEIQISIRELPKNNKKEKNSPTIILNPKRLEKSRKKIISHTQKPFENLKDMLNLSDKPDKLKPKNKEKLPRKKKKELNKIV